MESRKWKDKEKDFTQRTQRERRVPGSEVGPRVEEVVGAGGSETNGSGSVVFGEPGLEGGADVGLNLRDRGCGRFGGGNWKGRRSGDRLSRDTDEGRGVGGFRGDIVDGGDDALGVEMPFGEKAIGGQAAVQRAAGDPVKIGDVGTDDGAEAIEIEMRVAHFERVEGPFDEADVA